MNKNIVVAVAKRDLRSWFGNPTGYVFISLFVIVSTVALMWSGAFFTNNLANLDTWNAWFPYIAIGFVAASTMNIWASERANGTQELLFTLPGRDFDLQAGKFLAAAGVYTIALLFTLPLPIALNFLGSPDWGQLFANYVGFWLFGAMLVSVSMIGSQLTHNGTVALVLSVLISCIVVFFGAMMGWLGYTTWAVNGPTGQFAEFARGMLPVSGVVLFVGLAVAFFYLGLSLLARRHWREQGQGLHAGVRFGSFAISAFAATIVGVHALPRFDSTFEGIHSLGAETKALLQSLDAEKPVYVTAYVSEAVPEQFVAQRNLLLNLLDQFDNIGGNAVEVRIVMPEPYSPAAREAETNFGIRPQMVANQLPGGGVVESQVFLGFATQCGTDEVVAPFLEPALPLEYELMRSIRTVSGTGRKKIGLLKTEVEFAGGFDPMTFRQKQQWLIAEELKQQYVIESVDPEKDYPAVDCLVVPQASSLEQGQMDRLKNWIQDGNPTLLLEDPAPLDAWGTAADDQKGGMQAMMMGGGGGPQKGNFAGLLDALSIQAPTGEVVWDTSSRGFPGGRLREEFVFVRKGGFAAESPITKGLQDIVVLIGGHIVPQQRDGVTFTPLLRSLNPMQSRNPNGIVRKQELFQFSFGGPQLNPYARREQRNTDLTIAARITGKPPEGKQKGLNAIYVADLDMIGNQFFQIRRQYADPNLRFDNVTFVLNCIDTLVGDESLIELRKRRPILRKLESVEKAQEEYENTWLNEKTKAETEAQASLDEAQKRFDGAVAKIRDDASLDEQAKEVKIVQVQQQENRKLELEKAQIEDAKKRRLEEAQHDRDAARKGIHDRYRGITLVFAVLPGLLLGFVTWRRRTARAAAIVPQNRQVRGGVK
jgi:ABC-2 type transport system permease protein